MFAELIAATNYSFLRGASHPAEMVHRAAALGMSGIGIADRNSVAGVVRAYVAARELAGFRLVVGARLVFADGTPDVVAYPRNRAAWGRLTRLLTLGNRRAEKGDCILHLGDLLDHAEDLALIVLPASSSPSPRGGEVAQLAASAASGAGCGGSVPSFECRPPTPTAARQQVAKPAYPLPHGERGERAEGLMSDTLHTLRAATPHIWLAATMHRAGKDARRLAELQALSAESGIPLIASNDALYARPEARPLHDVLTCIREGVSIQSAGKLLQPNAVRYLKDPEEMARLFRACPEAISATQDLLSCIDFSLDQLRYEYPHEPVPEGWDPQGWLEHMVQQEAQRRYPDGVPDKMQAMITEEFGLIRFKQYAPYFLTVHDIVRYARSLDPPILCQGRGSAANSVVCYLLGITSVDPVANKLLFSRFLSEARDEPPDIDVDFEHERREEVMQYIYRRYGRERAGIAATVIHYRPRSTLREVGKALGLTEDVTARLSGTIWGQWGRDVPEERVAEAGFDLDNPDISRLKVLVDQLLSFPRHLSQHVGGFILTEGRLDELVPIHNAAMPDRTFIEWDKDDIDALGLMKVDVLSLGMLTCIRKAFDMINGQKPSPLQGRGLGEGAAPDLADGPLSPALSPEGEREKLNLQNIPQEDPAVFQMLRRADSIGTFQVESRAQINMLPRMKPKCFYDIVIQVAIVRPGPIQGGMVHPYLRRRNGEEKVVFPSPAPPHDPHELHGVLGKTLGVPLFQEQAMQLAITAACFTPAQADGLRRAMATFRHMGTIHHYHELLVGGMVSRGYEADFAERCFEQISGFGEYGFPESHAQAFGWLAYVSCWLKCHHQAVFTCALLNSQPMGFYAPAQLVRDAQEHGVEVRAVDVNASGWDTEVAISSPSTGDGEVARICLRLGFRMIDGFREVWAESIVQARTAAPFISAEDLARRAALPPAALRKLADADAFGSLGQSRRNAVWDVRRTPSDQLPLFAFADAPELGIEADAALPPMPLSEEVVADYQTTRLSLKAHPMSFLREALTREGVLTCADSNSAPDGRRVRVAGVVLMRQRPGKGNAVFITIEDETGVVNALLWARDMEDQRRAVMSARLMLMEGEIQRSTEGVVHLMAKRIIDRTAMLEQLSAPSDAPSRPAVPQRGRHPRDVRVLPKSRDFH